MKDLNFIDRLINGADVELKSLGEVAEIKRGTSITQKSVTPGEVPVIAGGRTPAYFHNVGNRSGQTIVIAGSGAYAGFVSWWEQPIFVSDAFTVEPYAGLLPKYCFYWLMGLQQQLHELKSGGGVPHVYPRDVSPLLIPIPCPNNPEKSLEIQTEIVRILDNFTELTEKLTAELKAELTARKKQYNYYRDQLLSFDEAEFEWKTLGDVANFTNGKGHEKDISEDGEYVVVNSKFISTNGQVAKFSDRQICPLYADDILIVMSDLPNGKALSRTFIVDLDGRYTLNQRIGGITVKNKNVILPKFLHHYLNRTKQLTKFDNGVDQTNLRKDQILGLQIPILSLAEQTRIVAILDKLDAFTNSITEGLLREIELRQKQYEYYRDMLLSFPKPEVEV